MPKPQSASFKMRIRVYAGERMLGPGKMELLGAIDATGSLAAASKRMGMSYMRAWKLAQELNGDSDRPMIAMTRGGAGGGTAKVTALGKRALQLYQKMDRAAFKAAAGFGRQLARLLQ